MFRRDWFSNYNPDLLEDLGVFKYSSNKDLQLFYYTIPVEHEMFRNCRCESYFENKDGVMIPEMDAFALIPRTQWQCDGSFTLPNNEQPLLIL
ncbi:NUDIX hydrolase [Escherichia phage T4]|nr:NUDIX hydrolase [Escherichia phage T4]